MAVAAGPADLERPRRGPRALPDVLQSSTARYVVRRVVWAAVMLVVVSALTFLIFYTFPSADPAALRAGRQATPQLIAQIRHALGLDRPVYAQFLVYMKNLGLHFDLGYSYQNNVSVRSEIFTRLPATVSLTAGALLVWMLIGIPVGILSALRPRSPLDRIAMGASLVGISAPVYWLGLLALFLFASDIGKVHLFGGAGSYVPLTQDPGAWFRSLILPWLVL
ncbi:MAG TPA: ABC transporter permease, partial [Gemmataceae bacterium]|nr:ABC transporter permease [Gemmataceae bacterium]